MTDGHILDDGNWSGCVSPCQLSGVEDGGQHGNLRAVDVDGAGQASYVAFNVLTYATHYPNEVEEFIRDSYPEVYESSPLSVSWREPYQVGDDRPPEATHKYQALLKVSLTMSLFENTVADRGSEPIQAHYHTVSENRDAFNLEISHADKVSAYTGTGEPVKLVPDEQRQDDALEW